MVNFTIRFDSFVLSLQSMINCLMIDLIVNIINILPLMEDGRRISSPHMSKVSLGMTLCTGSLGPIKHTVYDLRCMEA